MFDIDEFVASCQVAVKESEPRLAVKELLERAVSDPVAVAEALPVGGAELTALYADDELTVLKVIWSPGLRINPHNHLMWAAIGLYAGQEDNSFYRRAENSIVESGGKQLRTSDAALLGDDTIHSIVNPLSVPTAAIHVYGGNLTSRTGRSEWVPETLEERPYDFAASQHLFESANGD
jgi:predicted metal-dependent enzyme (double-stranded beta helix superfamily)